MLNCLVEEKGIAPHIPVFDKSKRDDGTFTDDVRERSPSLARRFRATPSRFETIGIWAGDFASARNAAIVEAKLMRRGDACKADAFPIAEATNRRDKSRQAARMRVLTRRQSPSIANLRV
jgi:hypothetical protein